jgi:hypothetical protein
MPTLLAAAGESDVVEKLKKGYKANGGSRDLTPDWKMPFTSGKRKLNAIERRPWHFKRSLDRRKQLFPVLSAYAKRRWPFV